MKEKSAFSRQAQKTRNLKRKKEEKEFMLEFMFPVLRLHWIHCGKNMNDLPSERLEKCNLSLHHCVCILVDRFPIESSSLKIGSASL